MPLAFHPTLIEGVVRIELDPIRDDRGFFARAWSEDEFAAAGLAATWVQANLSHNPRVGTLRGRAAAARLEETRRSGGDSRPRHSTEEFLRTRRQ